MSMTIRETPPATELTVAPGVITEYRSVPGRAVWDRRRIDISSSMALRVTFERLRPTAQGPDRTTMGRFYLEAGHPLMWVVPEAARMEDVLVIIDPLPDDEPDDGTVVIGDHWATS